MDIAIKTQGLRKAFKGTDVLNGVDLEVRRGDIFALLGPNGAGKTTTINILSTLLQQGGGTASVGGFDTRREPGRVREQISLTGQFAAVDGMLTGRENLVLVGRLRAVAEPAGVAERLLGQFGLRGAADRRVDAYSGGMVRRLDIAMSLVGTPAIIFLDEPTTGLDPEGRLEVWSTIRALAGSGTTILLTTQHLDEAEKLASHIAILHGGRIIADGTLAELKALFPPATIEYVEKQPSLEDMFLAIVGSEQLSRDVGTLREVSR